MQFAIESICIVPISRQRVYEAETFEQALLMAFADNDWQDAREDYASMMIILRQSFITPEACMCAYGMYHRPRRPR